jgi:hypothetical protein
MNAEALSDFGMLSIFVIRVSAFILLSSVASTLTADPAALHRSLVAAAGTAAFATTAIATGLLASATLAALVCAATIAASIAVLSSFVACHIVSPCYGKGSALKR